MKHGAIIESHISTSPDSETAQNQATSIHKILENKNLHEIKDWNHVLGASMAESDLLSTDTHHGQDLAQWLNSKLGH